MTTCTLAVGDEIRIAREAAGLSRPALARKVDVHPSTITRLELEDRLPNTRSFAAIARVLGVSVDDLLEVRGG